VLSSLLGVPSVDIVKILINLGVPPNTADEYLLPEVVDIIVGEFGRIPNRDSQHLKGQYDIYPRPPADPESPFPRRPPNVVILGHVNHGKTTLLDALRKSSIKIVDGEAGGITQRVTAFEVILDSDHTATVLDTPGHAAFEKMRERGTHVADIAILVVDADKGVQQQTLNCIEYLKKYSIPTIVALNKMDKQSARPKTVRAQLVEAGIQLEGETGGDVPLVGISALYGKGIDELKELLVLLSDIYNLKADRNGPAEVTILESKIEKNKGVVCSGIVRCGTLRSGQYFVCGSISGKVRWIFVNGKSVKEALPGQPVEFTGLDDKDKLPVPGDVAITVDTEKKVQEIMGFRLKKDQFQAAKNSVELLHERAEDAKREEIEARLYAAQNGLDEEEYLKVLKLEKDKLKARAVPLILKADVPGSIEAIKGQIESFPKEEVNVTVIRTGIGSVTEADVKIANEKGADGKLIILGFDVTVPDAVKSLASKFGVTVHTFSVIYDLLDWLRGYCSKYLTPLTLAKITATLTIKETFIVSLKSANVKVAGCLVKMGTVHRGSDIEIRREGQTIFRGKVRQLRHLKDEVKSITSGRECGIMVSDDFIEFEEGDTIHCMEFTEKAREFDQQTS
jgi:translation initiation factor IF-2